MMSQEYEQEKRTNLLFIGGGDQLFFLGAR